MTVGIGVGQVTKVDKDILSAAITKAQGVYDARTTKTQTQLDEVTTVLDNGIAIFTGKVSVALQIPPTLTGTAFTPATLEFIFTDDVAWRGKITEVSVDGKYPPIHLSRVKRTNVGKITINYGLNLTSGNHEFIFNVEDYADVSVRVNINRRSPPVS